MVSPKTELALILNSTVLGHKVSMSHGLNTRQVPGAALEVESGKQTSSNLLLLRFREGQLRVSGWASLI